MGPSWNIFKKNLFCRFVDEGVGIEKVQVAERIGNLLGVSFVNWGVCV